MGEAVSVSPVAALLGDDTQTLTERWAAASRDIRGKVIAELMDVVVLSGARLSPLRPVHHRDPLALNSDGKLD
jgi:hypothetical protein